MSRLYTALLALALSGCPPQTEADPPPPPPPDHPGTQEECGRMCATLARLHCDSTDTCAEACWNVESSGVLTLCPALVATAKSCDEANRLSKCGQ